MMIKRAGRITLIALVTIPLILLVSPFLIPVPPSQVENWDKALWKFTFASRSSDITNRLEEFNMPVLVISGDNDRIVPASESIRLAGELPNAQFVVISNAGHVPHEERPAEFMQAVNQFLQEKLPWGDI